MFVFLVLELCFFLLLFNLDFLLALKEESREPVSVAAGALLKAEEVVRSLVFLKQVVLQKDEDDLEKAQSLLVFCIPLKLVVVSKDDCNEHVQEPQRKDNL